MTFNDPKIDQLPSSIYITHIDNTHWREWPDLAAKGFNGFKNSNLQIT